MVPFLSASRGDTLGTCVTICYLADRLSSVTTQNETPDGNDFRIGAISDDVSFRMTLQSQWRVPDFTEEAVPRVLLEECVELALHAPYRPTFGTPTFVLVLAKDTRRSISELSRTMAEAYVARRDASPELKAQVGESTSRIGDAPWIVVPCYGIGPEPMEHHEAAARYGSIFPAVQNLLLAFHGVGLGSWMTTTGLATPVLARLLELPDGILPCAVIPVGWPAEPLPGPRQISIEPFTFLNIYNNRLSSSPVEPQGPATADPGR